MGWAWAVFIPESGSNTSKMNGESREACIRITVLGRFVRLLAWASGREAREYAPVPVGKHPLLSMELRHDLERLGRDLGPRAVRDIGARIEDASPAAAREDRIIR